MRHEWSYQGSKRQYMDIYLPNLHTRDCKRAKIVGQTSAQDRKYVSVVSPLLKPFLLTAMHTLNTRSIFAYPW